MDHDSVKDPEGGRGAGAGASGVVVRLPIPVHRSDGGAAGRGTAGPGPFSGAAGQGDGSFTIDCADCAHRRSAVCDDCVVSFIVGRAPEDALVVDADEARAVRLLERAGLVPGVRHEAQVSGL